MDDIQIRNKAFAWLSEKVSIHGDVLPREMLLKGFYFDKYRVPLVSPQGIFKPQIMELPLTMTSTVKGPYKDSITYDGYLAYKYRGNDPLHRDNQGLREIMQRNIPLIYLHGLIPGKYLAVWPVYIIGDDPERLTFKVAVDDISSILEKNDKNLISDASNDLIRKYKTAEIKVRIHQRTFRERVIAAYQEQCALCRLHHIELLEAAHIISDSDPEGEPIVNNGISLCKLHHAAFDKYFIGINPDYIVEVRHDILKEHDGPVLLHALQGMNNKQLILPNHKKDWPSPELLEIKYNKFRKAS
ncbi:MAG: HNH endonuclease [Candidatus Delongbacteria bacterium]|nr:HNH endonuclease [Candidatus Delongbacteria bacterium]